jgi:hypothetical protein
MADRHGGRVVSERSERTIITALSERSEPLIGAQRSEHQ